MKSHLRHGFASLIMNDGPDGRIKMPALEILASRLLCLNFFVPTELFLCCFCALNNGFTFVRAFPALFLNNSENLFAY
jgi:hypothetical protein